MHTTMLWMQLSRGSMESLTVHFLLQNKLMQLAADKALLTDIHSDLTRISPSILVVLPSIIIGALIGVFAVQTTMM